jgi:hypothetical protein
MEGIYKFYWDCGRMGEIEGIFIADSKDGKLLECIICDKINKT